MSAKIPDELKADLPQTKWGKVLVATPVVMTVVATLLAGLASSEMTRAQYDRSLAAQQQSKACDQWSFFQAKRLRGALQLSTLDLLKGTTPVRPLDEASLKPLGELDAVTLAALLKGELPAAPSAAATDASVKAALEAVESMKPETEIRSHLAQVKDATLEEVLRAARDRSAAFDTLLKPVNQAVDRVEKAVTATAAAELRRDFTAARLRYAAARYDAEARLNQAIANLYELQVRKNNMSAERHHQRSGQFFYGMLTAQAAVVIATFSLAARQRNYLWGLAAAAGAAAVSFAIYVYLCM